MQSTKDLKEIEDPSDKNALFQLVSAQPFPIKIVVSDLSKEVFEAGREIDEKNDSNYIITFFKSGDI